MPKSGADRQRELRARRSRARIGTNVPQREKGEGEMRLDVWIRTGAMLALRKLAERQGVPQRIVLERLLLAARATEDGDVTG